MTKLLSDAGMDLIFREARTANAFLDRPVSEVTLRALYDLLRNGPTSLNSCPGRFVFVTSAEAKKRLEPALSEGNRAKTMAAPVTCIVAWDSRFFEHFGRLFPHRQGLKERFEGDPAAAETNAFRNSTLQGAYMIVAARAVGLDCGPMSGFDNAKVDTAFFPDGRYRSNFICNLGYGDFTGQAPRLARLDFDETCSIV
ncbi:MAG: malonic semialdehyde reductase [Pseudomonadota bacterium]|nr:malonic semialdehyde reductase [Pseudomonadota bacterium]